MVLVCAEREDTEAQSEKLAQKVIAYRIFEDDAGKMNKSLKDIGGEILVVSQFTLAADTAKGLRPSFTPAAEPAGWEFDKDNNPWNFTLPQEYINAAEQAYAEAVDDFLATYSFDTKKYNGTTDRNYVEANSTPLKPGWNVRLLSEEYFAGGYKDTRITKVVRKLNDLCQATVTCTDQIGTGWKKALEQPVL